MSKYNVYYVSVSATKMGGGMSEVEAASPEEAAFKVASENHTVRVTYVVDIESQTISEFSVLTGM